jgi:excisionase family DNA binding protein
VTTPELLTLREVAAVTRVSVDTIRRAIAAGDLPVTRLRGRVFIPAGDVTAWIDRSTTVQAGRRGSMARQVPAPPRPAVGRGGDLEDLLRKQTRMG